MKCYKCGREIQSAEQRFCAFCDAEFPPPLKLFVKHRRTLRHDAPGMLICWVERANTNAEFSLIELGVSSPKLGHLNGNCGAVSMASDGKSHLVNVEVEPLGAREVEVEFFVILNQHWVARGVHRLHVGDLTTAASHRIETHIHSGDVSGNAARLGDQINVNLPSFDVAATIPEETHEVHIRPLLRSSTDTDQRTLKLTLPTGQSMTLVGATDGVVTLGRGRDQDIVLRGSDNELSTRISRKHAAIQFGDTVTWTEIASESGAERWGTTRDGIRLIEDKPYRIETGQEYVLAQAVTVAPTLIEGLLDAGTQQAYERYSRRLGAQAELQRGRIAAVRLDITNDIGQVSQYLLMQRAVRIGSHPDCAIRVMSDNIGPFHARLVYLAGRFWIEPCQKDSRVFVRGEQVPNGHRALLQPDDELVLGHARFVVQADTSRRASPSGVTQ